MLIRNLLGNVFHIVCTETSDKHYYIGLCGILINKTNLYLQTCADGTYSRCWTCHRIQNNKIRRSRPEVFGLAAKRQPIHPGK